MTYPDGEQVTYDYPSAGGMAPVPRPSEVDVGYQGGQSVIASGVSYFSDGVVASLTYGNGSLRQLTRNKRGEWTHLVSGPAAAPVLDQAYQFDGNGMGLVTAVHWFENQYNAWDWTFGYDALNRLTNYTTNVTGTAQSWAWTYDEVGNRLSDSYNGGTPNAYTYDSSGATSQLSSADGVNWSYDANGNVQGATPGIDYVASAYDTRNRYSGFESYNIFTGWLDDEDSRSYDAHGRLWQDTTGVSQANWTQYYYDLRGRILQEYSYSGQQVNGAPAYQVIDHFYLREGAGEVGRLVRMYEELTTGVYAFVDQDLHYVHEDYRHSPFAIEGYVEKGLVWEGELDPFANMVAQGLPGPDGKIGTSDDTAALTSQVYSSMKSRMQYGNYFTSMGRNNWRGQYGEMGSGMGDSLLDIGGPSSYAPNGGPDTLLSIGGSGNAHGGSPWSQGLGGAGSFSGGPMTGNAGGGSGWSQNLGGASGLTNPGSGNPFSQLGGGGLPYSGLFNAGGVNQSPLQTNGALIAGGQGLVSDGSSSGFIVPFESSDDPSDPSFFGGGDGSSGASSAPNEGSSPTPAPNEGSSPTPTPADAVSPPSSPSGGANSGNTGGQFNGPFCVGTPAKSVSSSGQPSRQFGVVCVGRWEPGDDDGQISAVPVQVVLGPKLDVMPSDNASGGGAVDPSWVIGRVCEPGDDSTWVSAASPSEMRGPYGGGARGDNL